MRELRKDLQQLEAEAASQAHAGVNVLAGAARARERHRSQARQLTARLGLQRLEHSRLEREVADLRADLAEQERRLQDTLDELETATAAARAASGKAPPAQTAPTPGGAPGAAPAGTDDLWVH